MFRASSGSRIRRRTGYVDDSVGSRSAHRIRAEHQDLNMGNARSAVARGCLLGCAVGDALGAPVEFQSLASIRERFGPAGITEFARSYGRLGAITDDTQMTLFTAEGLLRAQTRSLTKGTCHPPSVMAHAYARWLFTQGEVSRGRFKPPFDGWLVTVPELHDRRAPGNTCVSALVAPEFGTTDAPTNGSKGCGAVMRMAPVGILLRDPGEAFAHGCDFGAITHGHPSGYLAAGAVSAIIAALAGGKELSEAVYVARGILAERPGHEECTRSLDHAFAADAEGSPSADVVQGLGVGWVAEEALAIAVYCALAADSDFEAGVRLAVNHSGDSDSTGAIAGAVLGTMLGEEAIPERWLDALELRDVIGRLGDDLATGFQDTTDWWERYPGW